MKVAIVHYWLINMRGGEKVIEALLEMFPEADIYTHVYKKSAMSAAVNKHRVYTSYINKLPFASKLYQVYMPLMPAALRSFNLQDYDLIISSEAGPAKGIVPSPDAYHICYCHSPMRYIWDMYHCYLKESGFLKRLFLRLLTGHLRLWDITSANLVDCFISNSAWTAQRVLRYYNRSSEIIFAPIETEKYLSLTRSPQDYYLFFGQITYNKRVDIALDACIALGRKIIVAGGVSDKKLIARYKKESSVTFIGRVSDEEIKKLLCEARALLFPGIEDMGLVPVEAAAAGCPVIAYRKAGSLDTVKEGVTGIFFDEQTSETLAKAIVDFEKIEHNFTDRAPFNSHAAQFSRKAFKERVQKIIDARRRL